MQVEIDETTIQRLKQLFLGRLGVAMTSDDVAFFTDFMAGLGIDTVNAVLEKYPDMTFGDLITRYTSKRY
jgi:hypothetical protein